MDYIKEYQKWMDSEKVDLDTKSELAAIKDNDEGIKSRFYQNLEFGTAGLRGILGAGTNRMNIYVIRNATQGIANLIKSNGEDAMKKGVVIGYDCRNMSKEFADETAKVLAANGIRAYLFDALRPTPEISFAIRELGAISGINITASHNPKEYNGYKVYWDDGAQLPPDHADVVYGYMQKLDIFNDIKVMDFDKAVSDGLIVYIGSEIDEKYINCVLESAINTDVIKKVSKDLKIIYTPFHGTGYKLVPEVLNRLGFENVSFVEEQMVTDGNFPTVKSPNPENKEGFELAIKKAKEQGSDIIIGTDPDADRVAVVVKNKDGEYVVITGNQAGALLLDYIIRARREKGTLPENACAVKTIVSTEMATKIARANGVEIMNVLTGFKFIGEKIKEFEETGSHTYILGFEESIGYLIGTHARDKDAIVASMMLAEMAAYYKNKGITLYEALLDLYDKYGWYLEKTENMYFGGIDGTEKMRALMEKFRNELPESIGGLKVAEFRDYQKDMCKNIETGEITSTNLPKSNVLYYKTADDSVAVIRPSGTEPKIKLYIMVNGNDKQSCLEKIENIKNDFMSKM